MDSFELFKIALREENTEVIKFILNTEKLDCKYYLIVNSAIMSHLTHDILMDVDADGNNILHICAMESNRRMIYELDTYGLLTDELVNMQNNLGCTPLHLACLQNNKEIFDTILRYVQVNIIDNDGDTALHYAAHFGNYTYINALLQDDYTRNLKITNYWEENAYDYADAKGKKIFKIYKINEQIADLTKQCKKLELECEPFEEQIAYLTKPCIDFRISKLLLS